MPHDEDVRLVRELTLYPIQPYPARGATANAAFGRILARYDALVAEHEAYRPHRFTAYVSDEHDAAYDNVERVMKP